MTGIYDNYSTRCPLCDTENMLYVVEAIITETDERIQLFAELKSDGFDLTECCSESVNTQDEIVCCSFCKNTFPLAQVQEQTEPLAIEEEYQEDYKLGKETFAQHFATAPKLGDFSTALNAAKIVGQFRYRNYPRCDETTERILAYFMGRMMAWREVQ